MKYIVYDDEPGGTWGSPCATLAQAKRTRRKVLRRGDKWDLRVCPIGYGDSIVWPKRLAGRPTRYISCGFCDHLVRHGHPVADPKNMKWSCGKFGTDFGPREEGGLFPRVPGGCKHYFSTFGLKHPEIFMSSADAPEGQKEE